MDRRPLLEIVPIGTWLGAFALIAMALTSPVQPYVIYGALVVIAYTVWGLWRRLDEAERHNAPPVPAETGLAFTRCCAPCPIR